MDGYGALLTHAHMLRKTLWSYRELHGEWPREREARDRPIDAEYMGMWAEVADTLPITREVREHGERHDRDYDPEVFGELTCHPGVTTAYVRFRFAESTTVHLHDARVEEGVIELPLDGGDDWVVEVQRFGGPSAERMTARAGDHASTLDDVLGCWGMVRIYPNEGRRVVWVSTPTQACTVQLVGEQVTLVSCTDSPARAPAEPERAPDSPPASTTASGTQNIPGVKSHTDDDYTGLDYDWDDYNPD